MPARKPVHSVENDSQGSTAMEYVRYGLLHEVKTDFTRQGIVY